MIYKYLDNEFVNRQANGRFQSYPRDDRPINTSAKSINYALEQGPFWNCANLALRQSASILCVKKASNVVHILKQRKGRDISQTLEQDNHICGGPKISGKGILDQVP